MYSWTNVERNDPIVANRVATVEDQSYLKTNKQQTYFIGDNRTNEPLVYVSVQ